MYRARRRHFLLAAAALTASGYLRAAPKSAAVRRIGYLTLDSPYEGEAEAFKAALQEAGYGEEAKRLVIEYRHAKRDMDSLPALAADLVRRKVDLIIGFSNDEIKAAMQATRTIPIVMLWPGSPVEDRLVESLSRPGGNVTGTTYFEPEMLTRSFHLLMEARPTIRRIAVLWNSSPGYLTYKIGMRRVDELSAARGVQLEYYDVHRTGELTPNLQRIASSRADALFFLQSPFFYRRAYEVTAMALERQLPSIGSVRFWIDRGGLLAYTPEIENVMQRQATFVGRILRGARPADLPVEQPSRYVLGVNLKTAKAIGLDMPKSLLLQAERIIE